MDVLDVKVTAGQLFITLATNAIDQKLFAVNRNTHEITFFEFIGKNEKSAFFRLDAASLDGKKYFNIYVEDRNGKKRIGKNLYSSLSSNQERFLGQTPFEKDDQTLFLNCYLTYPGTGISLFVKKNDKYNDELFGISSTPKLTSLKKENNYLSITGEGVFLGELTSEESLYVLASARHLEKSQKINTAFSYVKKSQGVFSFSCEINIKELLNRGLFENRFVDLFLVLVDENGMVHKRRLTDRQKKLSYISGDDIFTYKKIAKQKDFYPYLTRSRHRGLSIMFRDHRPADSFWCQLKEHFAVCCDRLLPRSRKSRWVLFEHESQTAQDNAFVFFKWLKDHHPEQKSYYIIDKRSKDRDRLTGYTGVVDYFSLKHLMLMLRCSLIISSQSRFHGYKFRPLRTPMREKIISKENVFLQHGVLGLKKVAAFNRENFRDAADSIVVSSEKEKNIVKDYMSFDDDQIMLTGLARFDKLTDKSSDDVLQVLVIPTWRLWLESADRDTFRSSEFFQFYNQLLHSDNLKETEKGKKIEFVFYLHSKIAEHLDNFECAKNVRCIKMGDVPVNELMMQSNVMITDYSSVAWDFLYMGKKVIFAHFDVEKYLATHGAYMDFNKELFGPQIFNIEELSKEIFNSSGGAVSYNLGCYFEYHDQSNCERIYGAIKKSFPSC